MLTTITGRVLIIAAESERTAEVFELAAQEAQEPRQRYRYNQAARTLREQADAVRLSVEPAKPLRTYGQGHVGGFIGLLPDARMETVLEEEIANAR